MVDTVASCRFMLVTDRLNLGYVVDKPIAETGHRLDLLPASPAWPANNPEAPRPCAHRPSRRCPRPDPATGHETAPGSGSQRGTAESGLAAGQADRPAVHGDLHARDVRRQISTFLERRGLWPKRRTTRDGAGVSGQLAQTHGLIEWAHAAYWVLRTIKKATGGWAAGPPGTV